MKVPWKLIGLAGVAGVTATGVVVARKRRAAHDDIDPNELRERLHSRLADAGASAEAEAESNGGSDPLEQGDTVR
jgi:hypothetical protein